MPDLSKLPAKSKVKLEVWSSRNLLRSSFHQKYPKLGPILQFIFAFFRDVMDELLLHCLHAHLKLSHLVHVSSAIKPAGVSLLEKQDSILFSKNPTKVQVAWCIRIRRSHIRIHTHTRCLRFGVLLPQNDVPDGKRVVHWHGKGSLKFIFICEYSSKPPDVL